MVAYVKRISAKEVIIVKEEDDVRTFYQLRKGPETVEENSSDHPGEEDDESVLEEKTRCDGSEERILECFWKVYLLTSCSRTTKYICASRQHISNCT